MREQGWRIRYSGVDFDFGGVDDDLDPFRRNLGRVYVQDYDVSEAAVTSEDTPLPRADGLRFGQDFRGGVTHTFTLAVRGRSRAEAEALMAEAARVWRGDSVRGTANVYAELTTMRGGEERTMMGRPRRFAPNYDRLSAAEITAVATFETQGDVWWGAEETYRADPRVVSLDGFAFPITFPLVMSSSAEQTEQLTIAGTLPTPAVVEIHGPTTNPVVRSLNGWAVSLRASIGAGHVVTFDSRPWRRTITDQTGQSWAGSLTRQGKLSDMVLRPGPQQVVLSGFDPSGKSYVVVRWRPAYAGRG